MAVIALAALSAVLTVVAAHGTCSEASVETAPGGAATREVPADYLSLYRQAGAVSGVPWSVLAAIGAIETDHGRSHAPRAHGPQTPVTGLSGARSARRPAGELIRAVQPSFRLLTLGRRGWRG